MDGTLVSHKSALQKKYDQENRQGKIMQETLEMWEATSRTATTFVTSSTISRHARESSKLYKEEIPPT